MHNHEVMPWAVRSPDDGARSQRARIIIWIKSIKVNIDAAVAQKQRLHKAREQRPSLEANQFRCVNFWQYRNDWIIRISAQFVPRISGRCVARKRVNCEIGVNETDMKICTCFTHSVQRLMVFSILIMAKRIPQAFLRKRTIHLPFEGWLFWSNFNRSLISKHTSVKYYASSYEWFIYNIYICTVSRNIPYEQNI